MSEIENPLPIVPTFLKQYITDYYSNMSFSFLYEGDKIETKSYYFGVIPTPEQIQALKSNFKNKSDYPYEIFLNNFMLHHVTEYDKTTKQYYTAQYLVMFLIGKIYSSENISFPNILSNDYLTASYYKISNIDINLCDHVNTDLPIILTNDNIISDNVIMAEKNVILPNSTNFVKVRTENVIIDDAYPNGSTQPTAIVFAKDCDTGIISKGGIALYNINFLTSACVDNGPSLSVVKFIETLDMSN